MSSIFQIHQELEALFYALPETGEMTDEQVAEYEALVLDVNEKHKSTIGAYKHFAYQEQAIDEEIKRLKAMKSTAQNRQSQILYLIDYTMKKMDTDTLEIGAYTAKRVKNPPKVEISPTANLPEEYVTKEVVITPDKAKIKEALNGGVEIEGCQIVQGTRISIK